jgi:molybdenum cofactor guanylyltransferase
MISALILAGGKATRFGGVAKHELVVEGETIFARQVSVLAPRVAEILVSGPAIEGYRNVRDAHEGVGPLAGIAAGLAACQTEWLLVVAGDMPFLTGELIDQMFASVLGEQPRSPQAHREGSISSGLDAIGVRVASLLEPLLCVLHRDVLRVIERRIAERRYKASGLLTDEGLRVHWLELDESARAVLRNINSPDDL